MRRLHLSGSPRKVIRTLESIRDARAQGKEWDAKRGSMRGGRKRKLSTIECEIAADQLARGTGLSQTLFNVNAVRNSQGKGPVGRTTLRDNVKAVLPDRGSLKTFVASPRRWTRSSPRRARTSTRWASTRTVLRIMPTAWTRSPQTKEAFGMAFAFGDPEVVASASRRRSLRRRSPRTTSPLILTRKTRLKTSIWTFRVPGLRPQLGRVHTGKPAWNHLTSHI
jgi:hypothetical protein